MYGAQYRLPIYVCIYVHGHNAHALEYVYKCVLPACGVREICPRARCVPQDLCRTRKIQGTRERKMRRRRQRRLHYGAVVTVATSRRRPCALFMVVRSVRTHSAQLPACTHAYTHVYSA